MPTYHSAMILQMHVIECQHIYAFYGYKIKYHLCLSALTDKEAKGGIRGAR